uniref:Uncharacterized protein n=1 Tax=Neolamprologus brichardi TaxID=32507 RepID=A0A3Q4I4J2_NEOBR
LCTGKLKCVITGEVKDIFPVQEVRTLLETGRWASKTENLVVAGNVVDLGNMWRFHYLCYKNGGGELKGSLMAFSSPGITA